MIIERSATSRVLCSVCRKSIEKGSLRVMERTLSTQCFHLDCFRPEAPIPYSVNSFHFKGATKPRDQQAVAAWVDRWNKQFSADEQSVPREYLSQKVCTVPTAARRRLIETFSFLTLKEVETVAARICREWLHVTRDQELWKTRFMRQFHPTDTEAHGDYRRKYIAYYLSACFGCSQFLEPSEVSYRCELSKKLICRKCALLPEFRITNSHNFAKATCLTPQTLEVLKVQEFMWFGAKSCYAKQLLDRILPHAKRRLGILLDLLEHSGEVSEKELQGVQALDLEELYRKTIEAPFPHLVRIPVSPIARLVLAFCGKCDLEERTEVAVGEFLAEIEKLRDR